MSDLSTYQIAQARQETRIPSVVEYRKSVQLRDVRLPFEFDIRELKKRLRLGGISTSRDKNKRQRQAQCLR